MTGDAFGIRRAQQRDLMELVDDRCTLRSTFVTNQYPIENGIEPWKIPYWPVQPSANGQQSAQNSVDGDSLRKILGEQELILKSTK